MQTFPLACTRSELLQIVCCERDVVPGDGNGACVPTAACGRLSRLAEAADDEQLPSCPTQLLSRHRSLHCSPLALHRITTSVSCCCCCRWRELRESSAAVSSCCGSCHIPAVNLISAQPTTAAHHHPIAIIITIIPSPSRQLISHYLPKLSAASDHRNNEKQVATVTVASGRIAAAPCK